jgi:hypothetical protein
MGVAGLWDVRTRWRVAQRCSDLITGSETSSKDAFTYRTSH